MLRRRLGAILGVSVATTLVTLSVVDCADPTEIVLDIRSDACGDVKNTGIAVSTPDRIDDADLTAFTPRPAGCEAKPADRVGTLTIYPSGAKDAEVGVRIVTGMQRNAQDCGKGPYAGCIVARRVLRFVPGTSQKVIVIMSRACEGKDCGRGADCESGQCVTTLPDGGVVEAGEPDADAPGDGGGADDGGIPEAGPDACVNCEGAGKTCTNGNTCAIDCNVATCSGATVCGPGLRCTVGCATSGQCNDTVCNAPGGSCRFDCTTQAAACKDITCRGDDCYVSCTTPNGCDGVNLTGGDAGLNCNANNACSDGYAHCDAGRCVLACNPGGGPNNACPMPRTCNSNCTGW